MEKITISDWDLAESYETADDIRSDILLSIEDDDIEFLYAIIECLPRAPGLDEIAAALGVNRTVLCKSMDAISKPGPNIVDKLLGVLGMKLDEPQIIPTARHAKAPEAKAA
jgi:DNA-binding phage protein